MGLWSVLMHVPKGTKQGTGIRFLPDTHCSEHLLDFSSQIVTIRHQLSFIHPARCLAHQQGFWARSPCLQIEAPMGMQHTQDMSHPAGCCSCGLWPWPRLNCQELRALCWHATCRLVRFRALSEEFGGDCKHQVLRQALSGEDTATNATLYILMRAVDRFYETHKHFPGTFDRCKALPCSVPLGTPFHNVCSAHWGLGKVASCHQLPLHLLAGAGYCHAWMLQPKQIPFHSLLPDVLLAYQEAHALILFAAANPWSFTSLGHQHWCQAQSPETLPGQ